MRQPVDLDSDPGLLAHLGRAGDHPDLLDQPLAKGERGHEQLAEVRRTAESRQVVEEVGDVCGDVLVSCEEAEVLVAPSRDRVVVAGTEVDVAAEPSRFAPDDEGRLRVDLEPGEAVDDVDARLLERAGPLDVPALVTACLDLDEAHRLLPALRGVDQSRHERRVVARPVDGRLDRNHLGIDRSAVDEGLEAAREGVVRMVDQEVAAANSRELLGGRLDRVPRGARDRNPGLVLEIGSIELVQLAEIGEVELALQRVEELVRDAQTLLQLLSHRLGHRRRHLESRHLAEARAAELELDRLEQVVGLVGHLEVAVTRDAEE